MREMPKRPLAALLAAVFALLIAFAPCCAPEEVGIPVHEGTEVPQTAAPTEEVQKPLPFFSFTNGLSSAVDSLYVTPYNENDWNVTRISPLGSGETTVVTMFGTVSEGGSLLDLGAVDEDGVNYDAFCVRLFVGDSVRLTGDGENGSFAVTHKDGSKDFYSAKVYDGGEYIAPAKIAFDVDEKQLDVRDEAGAKLGAFRYQVLSITDRTRYKALADAISELNEQRRAAMEKLIADAYAAGETSGTLFAEERVAVRRCDTAIVSLCYQTTDTAGETSYAGRSFDPETAAPLYPSDVVRNVLLLPHMMNLVFRGSGEELELNEYRDHTADFSTYKADYAFFLGAEGLTFIFNKNAFRSGIKETTTLTFGYSEYQRLLRPRYYLPPEE